MGARLSHAEKAKRGCISRLNRIEGQVRGLGRMIKDGRSRPEIATQISAIKGAFQGFEQALIRNHVAETVSAKISRLLMAKPETAEQWGEICVLERQYVQLTGEQWRDPA